MSNNKKTRLGKCPKLLLSLVLTLATCLSSVGTAFAANPNDYTDPSVAIIQHANGGKSTAGSNSNFWDESGNNAITNGNKAITKTNDITSSYTVTIAGYYTLECYGGNGAAAGLSCADSLAGYGAKGGYIAVKVYCNVGDVIQWTVGSGGVPAYRPSSQCYGWDGWDGHADNHASIGASGRDTYVKVNGVEVARAYGGTGGVRFCCCSRNEYFMRSILDGVKSGYFNKANNGTIPTEEWWSDDAAVGGYGGSYSYNSSKATLVKAREGEHGQTAILGDHTSAGQSGLAYQTWYNNWYSTEKESQAGMFLMSLAHEHDFTSSDSTCTESGTANKICSICGGTQYGLTYKPAHGHNFVAIPLGTAGYECNTGSKYYTSHSNATSNKTQKTYSGASGWYYTYQCTYCQGMSDPQPGYYYIIYDANTGTGNIPKQSLLVNKWESLESRVFNKVGYTQEGWSKQSGLGTVKHFTLGQSVYNLLNPSETMTLYAWWRPNTYTITWNANDGSGETYAPGTVYTYDQSYSAISQYVSGFNKKGYYIAWWQKNPNSGSRYYCDPRNPAGTSDIQEKFKNLTSVDKANVNMYAKWEPITYTIRIWDNYSTSTAYKDYSVKYDEKFALPKAQWSHGNAKVIGYDYDKSKIATSEWKIGDVLVNLTDIEGAVINIYTIWDNPPSIKSPASIDLPREVAKGHKINVSNGTISQSDIEEFVLNYVTATDIEYTLRYTSETVPNGSNHGYTVGVVSIDPLEISQNAEDHVTTYGIMFQIIDDAGQVATCTTTLFVGDNYNILVQQ